MEDFAKERARALALEEALSVTFGRYVKAEGRKALQTRTLWTCVWNSWP